MNDPLIVVAALVGVWYTVRKLETQRAAPIVDGDEAGAAMAGDAARPAEAEAPPDGALPGGGAEADPRRIALGRAYGLVARASFTYAVAEFGYFVSFGWWSSWLPVPALRALGGALLLAWLVGVAWGLRRAHLARLALREPR